MSWLNLAVLTKKKLMNSHDIAASTSETETIEILFAKLEDCG